MTPAAVFRNVTLWLVAPAVVLAAIWVAVQAAGEMTVTDFYSIRTYAEEVYTDLNLGRWTAIAEANGRESAGIPAAAGVALVCILVAASLWIASQLAIAGPLHVERRAPLVFQLGSLRWPLTLLVAASIALFVALPLINLVSKAGVQVTQHGGAYMRSWSPAKFIAMLFAAFPDNREEFGWSATIATLAASLVVAAAIPLAWWSRTNRAVAVIAFTLAVLALAIPGPIVGLALIRIFNAPNAPPLNYLYDYTVAAPAIAQSIRAFPLGLFIIWHAFRSIPQPLVEAAELDGAGPLRQLALSLRLRFTAIALAWASAFIVAFGELAATILVVPPGVTTLPVHIFGLMHYNVEDQVAAISLALIVLHAAAALVLFLIIRRVFHLRSTAASN